MSDRKIVEQWFVISKWYQIFNLWRPHRHVVTFERDFTHSTNINEWCTQLESSCIVTIYAVRLFNPCVIEVKFRTDGDAVKFKMLIT